MPNKLIVHTLKSSSLECRSIYMSYSEGGVKNARYIKRWAYVDYTPIFTRVQNSVCKLKFTDAQLSYELLANGKSILHSDQSMPQIAVTCAKYIKDTRIYIHMSSVRLLLLL